MPIAATFLTAALAGLFSSPTSGTMNALTSICSEYTYKTSGKRVDGVIFSASSFGQKVGTGVGTALTGWLLSYGGYVGTAAEQSASAISMISFMYLIIPIIGYGIACLIFWQLKVEQANAELDAKAAAAQSLTTETGGFYGDSSKKWCVAGNHPGFDRSV